MWYTWWALADAKHVKWFWALADVDEVGGGVGGTYSSGLGGEIQGHLCGQKIVGSRNRPLMNSVHAFEMAAIILADFMCLWGVPAKWVWAEAGLGVGGGTERGEKVKYYYLKHIPRHNKALKWKYCWDSFHYARSRPHYGISRSDCAGETWQYLHWIPIM